MIDLSFGFEQIWFDYSRNFVKFDEAAVKRRDISEKQFNWKRKASFYGRASFCAFNLLLCSHFVHIFSFSPAVFYDFPSIKVVCWGKCETFLALPDRADSALADFTAANRVQCPGDCCDQQPMTYFEL